MRETMVLRKVSSVKTIGLSWMSNGADGGFITMLSFGGEGRSMEPQLSATVCLVSNTPIPVPGGGLAAGCRCAQAAPNKVV